MHQQLQLHFASSNLKTDDSNIYPISQCTLRRPLLSRVSSHKRHSWNFNTEGPPEFYFPLNLLFSSISRGTSSTEISRSGRRFRTIYLTRSPGDFIAGGRLGTFFSFRFRFVLFLVPVYFYISSEMSTKFLLGKWLSPSVFEFPVVANRKLDDEESRFPMFYGCS